MTVPCTRDYWSLRRAITLYFPLTEGHPVA